MNKFFAELKRRNVVRVGFAYVVVSWVVLQFVDIVEDPMNLPDWFQRVVIILLAIGLPIVLIISWAFEVTPEGVKKTEEVDKSKSITHGTGQRINKLIAGGLVLAVAFIIYDKTVDDGVPEAVAGQASIAVLPFVNMSDDAANEYFADGLSEELLNVLAKVPDLKVAGRTSSFQFKGRNQDLREIGETLGVAHILEGSVRKQGSRVRITAQLIRASDGFHMWSETYDRDLEDIFLVQDEISAAIFDQLSVTLGFQEETQARAVPTTNMEAYDRFLEARVLVARRGTENLVKAENLLMEATQIDPGYAEAWGLLGNVYSLIPAYDNKVNSRAYNQRAVTAGRRAIELNPNYGLAYTGLGAALSNLYQFSEAAEVFEKGWIYNQNDAEGNSQYGQFLNAKGKFEESITYHQKAHDLDPLSELYVLVLASSLSSLDRKAEAYALNEMVQSPELAAIKTYLLMMSSLHFKDVKAALEYGQASATLWDRPNVLALYEKLMPVFNDLDAAKIVLREHWETNATPAFGNSSFIWSFAIAFKDYDLAIEIMLAEKAKSSARFSLNAVWSIGDFEFINYEKFRDLAKELGLLKYWQDYGFPAYCHAVGDDDYECSK